MKWSQSQNNYQTASRPSPSPSEFDWSIWDNPFAETTASTTEASSRSPGCCASLDNPFVCDDDASWSSSRTIRFADEVGQLLERICLVPSRQHANSQYLTGV